MVIFAGVAAWIVALLSDGPAWFTVPKLAAGLVMALSILGASVWHYGARADVYRKKHWDLVIVESPRLLMFLGAVAFLASIVLAWIFLPISCCLIAVFNTVTIAIYARILDRYWPWKNLSIAAVCVTPLILGWFSGHRLNPILPSLISTAFFFYLAREIFKDVVDIEANRGKRFTMVMSIGTPAALRVGGVALVVAITCIVYSMVRYAPSSLFVRLPLSIGIGCFSYFATWSLAGENIAHQFRRMDLGVASILIALLGVRLNMY
jgi:4-hydroxybenzoate polyprenyltransferase